MGNLDSHSTNAAAGAGASARRPWQPRTGADANSVLLELARAVRGFVACADPQVGRRRHTERAFAAITAEVTRSGPLDLKLDPVGFLLPEVRTPLDARGGLAVLHAALSTRAIERLTIDADLTLDSLQALLELLARREGSEVNTLLRALAARDARGLRLNDLALPDEPPPRPLAATPPRPSVSLTTTRIADSPTPPPSQDEALGARLRARLVELDHSLDDEGHARLATEIARWAEELFDAGERDACYEAIQLLADHAVGSGGRAEAQARAAASCFARLATGERLEDLIERALASDASGVRAAQILLQRREDAVPALIERLCTLPDPFAPGPLHALVLTTGEAAVPALLRAMAGRDETRARLALQLAGELQSPALLPALAATAKHAPLPRQIEAIRALCLIPGEASQEALAEALASQLDQIAIAATEAMAARTGIDAVPALLDVLDTHVRGSRTQLCRAVIEVLARLGDERAVPRLAALLERRPVLRRAHWHAIQLAAVDALAVLPSREARRSLERAASFAAAPIRDRAQLRLSAMSRSEEVAPTANDRRNAHDPDRRRH